MESTEVTTQQLMFSLIEIWQGSNKTQQQFCKEKDIEYHKFSYWFRKYRAVHSPTGTDTKFFKQIKLREQNASSAHVELMFPDGRKLIFYQPVDASFLRSLLG